MKRKRRLALNCLVMGFLCVSPFGHSYAQDQNDNLNEKVDEAFAKGVVVDLRDPVLQSGILSTTKGGVITAPGMRIQAKNIVYTRKVENDESIFKVEAEGHLMLEYGDRVFIGNRMEFDFNSETGTIYDGTTGIDPWFIGAAQIHLKPKGDYSMEKGYITTCGNVNSEWAISATDVLIPQNDQISASNIQVRFLELPLFWMPSFTGNVKKILRAPIQTRVHWGGSRGTRISLKYRFFSSEQVNAFMRLDYRLKRGFGGGIEASWLAEDKKTSFITRNYVANDTSVSNDTERKRYRFDGKYATSFHDGKTTLDVKYDRLSDADMPSDYDENTFKIDTAGRTEIITRRIQDKWILSLIARPKINYFQTLKEELPTLEWRVKPFEITDTGIISDNVFRASYLTLSHSDTIGRHLDYKSSRLQTQNYLYRPTNYKKFTFVPEVGFIGTHYDKTAAGGTSSVIFGVAGGEVNTHMYKVYNNSRHVVEPYARYDYYHRFEDNPDQHYIFDIDDSWSNLNMMQLGVRNTLFKKDERGVYPSIEGKIYTNAFIDTKSAPKTFPKVYGDISYNELRNFFFNLGLAYDNSRHELDHYNARVQWTKDENLAGSLEYRSREAFDWRKADRTRFFLESFRDENSLEASSLSDKRETILSNIYYRFSPNWVAHLQSRHGSRPNESRFDEFQIDLTTTIRCNWRGKISYQLVEPTDHRIGFHIRLDEGRPEKPSGPTLIWP
ncbi:MAG: hypothetical protein ACI9S8_002681 [Chlamydiales bacterium]|jgi:hypothetical protein